ESSRDEIEELRVVRGHVLERLRGIVVEVRGRVPDAAQLRDFERVGVLERGRAVQDTRDQRASGIRAEDMRLVGGAFVEDELPDRIVRLIEEGHQDILEASAGLDGNSEELRRELVGLVHQCPAVAMRAQTRLESVSGIRRNILEEAAPSLFGCGVASRQLGTGSTERGV